MTNIREDKIQIFLDGSFEHTTKFNVQLEE